MSTCCGRLEAQHGDTNLVRAINKWQYIFRFEKPSFSKELKRFYELCGIVFSQNEVANHMSHGIKQNGQIAFGCLLTLKNEMIKES